MNLAKYSLDNTKVIYFFLAVLLIGGVFSFGKLGKKEDAPFVIKSAVIMTRYPGAEPAEVERLITEPISREIQSMSGVYKIKSESMYGISKITFELLPSLPASSIPQKWDELRRKVLNIQPQLPSGSSVPTVSDDFGDVFGIYYGLTADDGFSYEEMRNWAERIKTQVVTADGVMKVALFGTQTEVVNISISVNKLAGMGIDPKQLAGLLQSQNQIINTGEITAGEQQLRVVANGMYTTVDDIRNQVITTRAGQVKLGDIAVIEKGYMDPPGTIMRVNGKRAIGIGVSTDPQRDVVLTGEMVDKLEGNDEGKSGNKIVRTNLVVRGMKKVEAHLLKLPEVKKVSITFGSTPLRYYLASTSVGPKPNFANVLVELNDSKYTKEYEEKFDVYMKANFPNAITRTSLFKLSPAVDAAIEIGFIGPNVDTLVALTNQALEIMHRNPDLINIRNSWGNKIPIWKPIYSPERAQPLGVSRQGMAQSIQIGTNGMTLGEFRQGDQVLPILLKGNSVADSFRINDLRTLPVFGNGPETTSLEQVVSEFDFRYRFSNVKDYNRQLVMMAQCDPRRGVNAIAAFNQIWSQVQKEIKIPEGYTLKYFGEQESQVESNEALAKNLPLTFFLMFTTLLLLFKTYRKPTVILLMLPLIFIGIVLGLLLLGKSFDFFAILGLLGLIGMNIKNAIVLVDQIDIENQSGLDPRKAVIKATISRIVPVAMASGTTILGMLPLLFDAMFGGMAATIMGGLLVASALTLFVLPVAYCAIHRIKG
jgi:multidrug efflux pump subunit AcrB